MTKSWRVGITRGLQAGVVESPRLDLTSLEYAANVDVLLVIGDPDNPPPEAGALLLALQRVGIRAARGSSSRLRGTGSIETFVGRRV